MGKFSTGIIVGSMIGAVGIGMMMNDKMTKRKMIKTGKRMLNKAENAIDTISDTVTDTMENML